MLLYTQRQLSSSEGCSAVLQCRALCCAAVRGEFKGPMFDLVEHSASAPMTAEEVDATSPVSVVDNTPRRMDIVKSFSPHPCILHIGVKISLAAWIVSAMAMSIQDYTYQSFWLAYLTNWVIVVCSAYAILSAVSAVYLAIRPPASSAELEVGAGILIKSTWALLAIAAPAQVVVTILYWTLLFDADDDVTYVKLMLHGIVMVLIMIDGFILSRIPLRMKQFILFESFAIVYVLWTVVHAYSGIGNPYADGETPTQDDDAIYSSLAWKNNTAGAAILSVIVLIVANPIIFMMCRALSRLLPRQLCEANLQESLIMSQL
ncbi:hypothetical protein ACHAW5_003774 [Stephanodiscus triporus]|uniref:Transmembrane protein n=1 Tax=Stephanodiscus triporus TaxID=2934178 RepID=A0ABD3NFM4_9STRA